MAEFELSILSRQALKRFDNKKDLIDQIYIWETERNKKIVKANWQFTKESARVKLKIFTCHLKCVSTLVQKSVFITFTEYPSSSFFKALGFVVV